MKKVLFFIIISVLLIFIAKHAYIDLRCKDISYSVNYYMTSSVSKSYRLYEINEYHLEYSDGNIAIMKVTGISKNAPHSKSSYKLVIIKNNSGIWHVKNIYNSK